jgi:hypothetical protein
MRIARNIMNCQDVLHAMNRGANAGDDFACNTCTSAIGRCARHAPSSSDLLLADAAREGVATPTRYCVQCRYAPAKIDVGAKTACPLRAPRKSVAKHDHRRGGGQHHCDHHQEPHDDRACQVRRRVRRRRHLRAWHFHPRHRSVRHHRRPLPPKPKPSEDGYRRNAAANNPTVAQQQAVNRRPVGHVTLVAC